MAYEFAGAFDAAVLDTNSQLLKSTAFELVTEPGGVLATLYTNRTRSALVAQPFLSDAEGNVHLFTDPGRYRLRQLGSPPGEEITVQPDPDETEGELEAHVIAADPHPVYLTQAEGDAGYDPIGSAAAGDASHVAAGDPHPVYLTAAEGSAAFAPIGEPASGAHVADPTDAHDASAVSFVPTGTIAATDVQSAIVEVMTEAGGAFVPVTRYGAVGDGVNDDTAEIQAALTAEPMVYFPPGNWKVSANLLPPSNRHILLAPGARVFVAAGVLGVEIFDLFNVDDVTIEGGELDGTKGVDALGTRTGVMVRGTSRRIVLERIYSHDFPGDTLAGGGAGDGFYVGDGAGVNVPQDIALIDCISEANVRSGLVITCGERIHVRGGSYSGTTGSDPGSGITIEVNAGPDLCRDILIENAAFNDNAGAAAITTTGINNTNQRDLTVKGCSFRGQKRVSSVGWNDVIFEGNTVVCGALGGAGATEVFFSVGCNNVLIDGNTIDAAGEDVYGFHFKDSFDVTLRGNLVRTTGRQAVFCDQRIAAGAVQSMEGFLIETNTFIDCNTGAGAAVLLFRQDVLQVINDLDVIHNRFIDRRGGAAATYGWSTASTTTEPVINRFGNRHSGLLSGLSQRDEMDSVLPGRGIRTTVLAADPTLLADGDIWATTLIDKVRVAGVTKVINTTPP